MKAWTKLALAVVVITAAMGVGGAAALQAAQPGDDPGTGIDSGAGAGTRDLGSGITESKYVAVQPCRIVDTRAAGGPIGNNQTRTFEVAGTTGFVPQGGKSGGCGIPAGASAVELSLTIVDASGGGFMRVFPGGTSEPTATFINYSPYNPTNTGTVTLCQGACAGGDLSVRGHGTGTITDVVIEVQGYYAKPLAARIDDDGAVLEQSRLVSVEKTVPGAYYLTFDRSVAGCVAVASPYFNTHEVSAVQISGTRVLVVMQDEGTNNNTDHPFSVQVTC